MRVWRSVLICSAIGIALCLSSSSALAQRTWTGAGSDSNWFNTANWDGGTSIPLAGESVTVAGGVSVLLSNDTAQLNSFIITNATLMFTNWSTRLLATNITIQDNGVFTPASGFATNEMSNRVYMICEDLVIESGGLIDADGLGWDADGLIINGTGAGGSVGSRAAGGSYGGRGGKGKTLSGADPYGATNAPTDPGSAGGYGYSLGPGGGNGGGAVRIIATNVVINGTISANGNNSGTYGGGGSGGGVYITCNTLAGTGGVVRANAGNGQLFNSGDGGGGRIAVDCTNMIGVVDIVFSVRPGGGAAYDGRMGTVWFPDRAILSETLSQFDGVRLFIPGFVSWSINSLTVTNGAVAFGDGAFSLTVTNDLVIESGAWLCLGGTSIWDGVCEGIVGPATNPAVSVGGDLQLRGGLLTLGGQDQGSIGVLDVGGNMILTNGGELFAYSGPTNAASSNGAYVAVVGSTTIGGSSWIYPYCHQPSGGAVLFSLGNLTIAAGGGIDADAKGFAWLSGVTYAPEYGATVASRGAGSGYGGKGGDNSVAGGGIYGVTNAPVLPGAPGGYGHSTGYAQPGGGSIQIDAANIVVDGTITAKGGGGYVGGYGGGGSGGGIFITCSSFSGSGSGLVEARGGNGGSYTPCGGGGGGRIAIGINLPAGSREKLMAGQTVDRLLLYEGHRYFAGTFSATNGNAAGVADDGEVGTAYFMTTNYTLTISGQPGAFGNPLPNPYGASTDYIDGTTITNTVVSPDDETNGTRHACIGWDVEDIDGNPIDSGSSTQAEFALSTNVVLTWYWTNEYYLAVSSGGNGSVNASSNAWYTNALQVTGLTASPSGGYAFAQWTGDVPLGSETNNPLTVTMDRARTIVGNFAMIGGQTKIWNGSGNWTSSTNWTPNDMPGPDGDAVIASGTVTISQPTYVGTVTVSNGATIAFTNWTAKLGADSVTVENGGTLKPSNAFADLEMSNRVYVVCSDFALESGGTINADLLGYKADGTNVYGRGAGTSMGGNRGSGGSYGGYGGGAYDSTPVDVYGLTNAPTDPGSASGYGYIPTPGGANGGGAVRIVATNVVINGTITANGGNATSTYGGGGSGGGIYITCETLAGTGGVIRANGGNAGASPGTGSGGGGRIAIDCTNILGTVDIRFGAKYGANNYLGRMGTVWFPDISILSQNLTQFDWIRLFSPGFTSWTVPSLTVTNGGLSFTDGPFDLTVSGDLTVENGAWLNVGHIATAEGEAIAAAGPTGTNPTVTVSGRLALKGGTLTIGGQYQDCVSVLTVGSTFTMSNGGKLYVYAGPTSSVGTGAVVRVTGTTTIGGSGSWIYPYSNPTNEGFAFFDLQDLTIASGSGFDAEAKGYRVQLGPGSLVAGGSNKGPGASHGGKGGDSSTETALPVYGSTNSPIRPGSGGGGSWPNDLGHYGGGVVRIDAMNITLDGTITADGESGGTYNGGCAGGSIFIRCSGKFEGTTGLLSADGSNRGSGYTTLGGGGGGRIAVWYQVQPKDWERIMDESDMRRVVVSNACETYLGSVTATNGTGYNDGEPGTIVFLTVAAPGGTVFMFR